MDPNTKYNWEDIGSLAMQYLPGYLVKTQQQDNGQAVRDALSDLVAGLDDGRYQMDAGSRIHGTQYANNDAYRHAASLLSAVRPMVDKITVTPPEKEKPSAWSEDKFIGSLLDAAVGNNWQRVTTKDGKTDYVINPAAHSRWLDVDQVVNGQRGDTNRIAKLTPAIEAALTDISTNWGSDENAQRIKSLIESAKQDGDIRRVHSIISYLLDSPAAKTNPTGGTETDGSGTGVGGGSNPVNPSDPTNPDAEVEQFINAGTMQGTSPFISGLADPGLMDYFAQNPNTINNILTSWNADNELAEKDRLDVYYNPFNRDENGDFTAGIKPEFTKRKTDEPNMLYDTEAGSHWMWDNGGMYAIDADPNSPTYGDFNQSMDSLLQNTPRAYWDAVSEYGADNFKPGDTSGSWGYSPNAAKTQVAVNMLTAMAPQRLQEGSGFKISGTKFIADLDLNFQNPEKSKVVVVDVSSGPKAVPSWQVVGLGTLYNSGIPEETKMNIKQMVSKYMTDAKAKITKQENGGVIKALSGYKVPEQKEDQGLSNDMKTQSQRSGGYGAHVQEVQDSRKTFSATDKARMGTMAMDIASAIAAWVPGYGTAVSGVLGLGSSIGNVALDIADPTVSAWDAVKMLGVNVGMDLMGLIPGVGSGSKFAKCARTVMKIGAPLMSSIALMSSAPGAKSAVDKIFKGKWEHVTVGEWKDLSHALSAVSGLSRQGAQAYKNAKFNKQAGIVKTGKTFEAEKVNAKDANGNIVQKKVSLNQDEIKRINTAGKEGDEKALAEFNAIMKSKPGNKDIEFTELPGGASFHSHWYSRPFSSELRANKAGQTSITKLNELEAENLKSHQKNWLTKHLKSDFDIWKSSGLFTSPIYSQRNLAETKARARVYNDNLSRLKRIAKFNPHSAGHLNYWEQNLGPGVFPTKYHIKRFKDDAELQAFLTSSPLGNRIKPMIKTSNGWQHPYAKEEQLVGGVVTKGTNPLVIPERLFGTSAYAFQNQLYGFAKGGKIPYAEGGIQLTLPADSSFNDYLKQIRATITPGQEQLDANKKQFDEDRKSEQALNGLYYKASHLDRPKALYEYNFSQLGSDLGKVGVKFSTDLQGLANRLNQINTRRKIGNYDIKATPTEPILERPTVNIAAAEALNKKNADLYSNVKRSQELGATGLDTMTAANTQIANLGEASAENAQKDFTNMQATQQRNDAKLADYSKAIADARQYNINSQKKFDTELSTAKHNNLNAFIGAMGQTGINTIKAFDKDRKQNLTQEIERNDTEAISKLFGSPWGPYMLANPNEVDQIIKAYRQGNLDYLFGPKLANFQQNITSDGNFNQYNG